MTAGLELTSLRKTYRRRRKPAVEAVRGFDLSVAEGELVGLLGPSGCGKSTTLRMIAGLEDVTSGSISVNGRTITHAAPGDRNVAVAFENYALYPPLTVRENLAFGPRARGETDLAERIAQAADRMGLHDLLDLKPASLSSGQKQRVSLARALARDPAVLLLDEPLSHLDAAQRETTRRELKRLQRETGYTTVLVTHDQQEAVSMADRIAVMRGGEMMQIGTPDQVYDDPANLFVAGFVGEPAMNLLPGRVGEGPGGRSISLAAGIDLPAPTLTAGREVVVGIRPQDLELTGADDGPADTLRFPAHVTLYEQLLEFGQAVVALPDVDRDLLVRTEAEVRLTAGSAIRISVPTARVYVFDAATGERLRVSGGGRAR